MSREGSCAKRPVVFGDFVDRRQTTSLTRQEFHALPTDRHGPIPKGYRFLDGALFRYWKVAEPVKIDSEGVEYWHATILVDGDPVMSWEQI